MNSAVTFETKDISNLWFRNLSCDLVKDLWSRASCQDSFPNLSITMLHERRSAAAAVLGFLLQDTTNNAANAVRGAELDGAIGSSNEEGAQVIQMVGGEGDDQMSVSEEEEQCRMQ